MKTWTRAALLAASMLTAAVATAPAAAQKAKKGEAAESTFKLSPKVRTAQDAAVKALQAAIPAANALGAAVQAKRASPGTAATQDPIIQSSRGELRTLMAAAEAPIAALEAEAKSNDELYVAQELRYRKETVALSADFPEGGVAAQQAAVRLAPYIDKLLANPSTPQASVAEYAFERGRISLTARQYAQAITGFERARAAGSTDRLLDAFIVDARIQSGDLAGAAASIEPMVTRLKAAGQPVPESYYRVAIENAYRAKSATAYTWEQRLLADYPSNKNWHDALVRFLARGPTLDLRQRLDVWRLLRAAKALADEKERRLYAQDALDSGGSREALAVLTEIRASISEPSTTALLTQATTRAAAAASVAKVEADARAASTPQSALTAANFNLQVGNYAKAAELYALAETRGAPDRDAVKLSLGIAQALAGDKASAKASFEAVTGSPRKETAAYWLVWLAQG
ncbi:MAG: hypothetical protein V4659_07870 [Pseudomonadota bacterium]